MVSSVSNVVLTCKYSNGSCGKPRATKRNGQPHTLCQIHRDMACQSQRRVDENKRRRKKREKLERFGVNEVDAKIVTSVRDSKNAAPRENYSIALVKSLDQTLVSPMIDFSDCSSLTDVFSDDDWSNLSMPSTPQSEGAVVCDPSNLNLDSSDFRCFIESLDI